MCDWLIYLDGFILFVLPIKSYLAIYLSGILYNICTVEFSVIIGEYLHTILKTTIQTYSTGYKITSSAKDINDVTLKEGIICLGSQKCLVEPSVKCSWILPHLLNLVRVFILFLSNNEHGAGCP